LPSVARPTSAIAKFHTSRKHFQKEDGEEEGKKTGAAQLAMFLSGCGYLDGTEITEAVSAMIQFSQRGYAISYFAPEGNIEEVYDHVTKNLERNEVRNIAGESTRISKANVQKMSKFKPSNFELLYIPGGNGAGRTLSNYYEDNLNFKVHPEVERAMQEVKKLKKVILFSGMSSMLAARLWGKKHGGPGVKITMGNDQSFSDAANALGATHINKNSAVDVVGDEDNLIVSTPGYLIQNATPYQVYQGIQALFDEIPNLSNKVKVKSDASLLEAFRFIEIGVTPEKVNLYKNSQGTIPIEETKDGF
jgi:enhancing lycopene biosynthesis protein 2